MLGHAGQGLEAGTHDAVVRPVVPPDRGCALDHEAASVDHLCEEAKEKFSGVIHSNVLVHLASTPHM